MSLNPAQEPVVLKQPRTLEDRLGAIEKRLSKIELNAAKLIRDDVEDPREVKPQ